MGTTKSRSSSYKAVGSLNVAMSVATIQWFDVTLCSHNFFGTNPGRIIFSLDDSSKSLSAHKFSEFILSNLLATSLSGSNQKEAEGLSILCLKKICHRAESAVKSIAFQCLLVGHCCVGPQPAVSACPHAIVGPRPHISQYRLLSTRPFLRGA